MLDLILKFFRGRGGGSGGLRPQVQPSSTRRGGPEAQWHKAGATAEAEPEAETKSSRKAKKKAKKKAARKARGRKAKKKEELEPAVDMSGFSCEETGAIIATPVTAEPVHPFKVTDGDNPNIQTCTFDPIRFDILKNWMVEYVPDLEGTLIFCTDYKTDWQANIFVQYREEEDAHDLEACLNERLTDLELSKENFSLNQKRVIEHRNGFSYGILESTSNKDGILLIEWEVVVPCYATTQLCLSASSAYEDWDKYRKLFKGVVDSIRPA